MGRRAYPARHCEERLRRSNPESLAARLWSFGGLQARHSSRERRRVVASAPRNDGLGKPFSPPTRPPKPLGEGGWRGGVGGVSAYSRLSSLPSHPHPRPLPATRKRASGEGRRSVTILKMESLAASTKAGACTQLQNRGRSNPLRRALASVATKYSSRSRSNFCWVALKAATRMAISSRSRARRSSRSVMPIPFRVVSRAHW